MISKKRQAFKVRKINPKFWVFCEGKTEEAYVNYLRIKYRLPIKIISKVLGQKIDQRIISSYINEKEKHEKDKVFLLYDADVESLLNNLLKIEDVTLLVSNPCVEYWFLLHYKSQMAAITEENCIRELKNRNGKYKKGYIDKKLEECLNKKQKKACDRAKKTFLYKNPSSNIYCFINDLENAKNINKVN